MNYDPTHTQTNKQTNKQNKQKDITTLYLETSLVTQLYLETKFSPCTNVHVHVYMYKSTQSIFLN